MFIPPTRAFPAGGSLDGSGRREQRSMDAQAERAAAMVADAEAEAQERFGRRRRRRARLGAILAVALIATGGLAWVTDGFSHPGGLLRSVMPQCPPTVALNGSGSTLITPLMQQWVLAYSDAASTREQGCVVVLPTYTSSGAEAGLRSLGTGGTEFVATEQPLNEDARASLPGATLTLPLAAGAVAVAYNVPGVGAGLNLSGAVLAGIYLGAITTWNAAPIAELNPGATLPATPISVLYQASGSGGSYVFTGFLSAANASWAHDIGQGSAVAWPVGVAAAGDAGAGALLRNTTGGIAYLGLGTALEMGLSCAKLENPAGRYVAPSPSTVFAALSANTATLPLGNESWQNVSLLDEPGNTSYPLTTFTYAIVFADLGKAYGGALPLNVAQWLAAFLYWMSVGGQPYGTALGFAPFAQTVTDANQQIVELLKYDGAPALGDVDYDGD